MTKRSNSRVTGEDLGNVLNGANKKTVVLVFWKCNSRMPKYHIKLLKKQNKFCKIVACDFITAKNLENNGVSFSPFFNYTEKCDYSGIYEEAVQLSTRWFIDPCSGKDFSFHEGISLGELVQMETIFYFKEYYKLLIDLQAMASKEQTDTLVLFGITEENDVYFDILHEACGDFTRKIGIEFFVSKIFREKSSRISSDILKLLRIRSAIITLFNRQFSLKLPDFLFSTVEIFCYKAQIFIQSFREKKNDLLCRKKILLTSLEIISYNLEKKFFREFFPYKDYWFFVFGSGLNLMDLKNFKCIDLDNVKIMNLSMKLEKAARDLELGFENFLKNIKLGKDSESARNAEIASSEYFLRKLVENRFLPLLKKIIIVRSLLDCMDIDLIITHADTVPFQKMIVQLGKNKGIPSIVLQHGITGDYSGFLPITADRIAVWGDISRKFLLRHEKNRKKVVVIGNPKYDLWYKAFFDNNGNCSTSNSSPFLYIFEDLEILFSNPTFGLVPEVTFSIVDCIARTMAANFSNRKLIILHKPVQPCFRLEQFWNPKAYSADIEVIYSRVTQELIKSIAIAITSYSTVGINAIMAGKPLIQFIPPLKYNSPHAGGVPYFECGAALKTFTAEGLASAIESILRDQETQNKLAVGREKFLREYCHKPDGMAGNRFRKLMEVMMAKYKDSKKNDCAPLGRFRKECDPMERCLK